jgi:hypothetical protein
MRPRCSLWMVMLLLTLPLPGVAQPYAIDWFTVDGGGGTSTNGQFSLAGTIGQPDAGAMNGGMFALEGGFWGLVAVLQTPGGPTLAIAVSNNTVIVSWPAPADGWLLHYTTTLGHGGTAWTEIPPPYQTNGLTSISYSVPLTAGSKFFQLHKP